MKDSETKEKRHCVKGFNIKIPDRFWLIGSTKTHPRATNLSYSWKIKKFHLQEPLENFHSTLHIYHSKKILTFKVKRKTFHTYPSFHPSRQSHLWEISHTSTHTANKKFCTFSVATKMFFIHKYRKKEWY